MDTIREFVVNDIFDNLTKSSSLNRSFFANGRLNTHNTKSSFHRKVKRIYLEYLEPTDISVSRSSENSDSTLSSIDDVVQSIIQEVWLRAVNEFKVDNAEDFSKIHQCNICGEWAHYTVICNPIEKHENPNYDCLFKGIR